MISIQSVTKLRPGGRLGNAAATLLESLPQSPNGSILITSRSRDVAFRLTGSYADIIRVQRFFVTSRGYIGRGRIPIEEGDLVCILFGAKVPFILRAAESPNTYRLLGESCEFTLTF